MNAQDLETSLAIRQHYHELREAHDAGYANGNEHGVHMTIEQSWERFIGDYGKEEVKQPVPFFESQLHELCVALGWQGGTYHMVLAEVKRLKALEANQAKQRVPPPPAFIFNPSSEREVCQDCMGYSVVPGPCGTCGGRGSTPKGMSKVLFAISDWRSSVFRAWNEPPSDNREPSHC